MRAGCGPEQRWFADNTIDLNISIEPDLPNDPPMMAVGCEMRNMNYFD